MSDYISREAAIESLVNYYNSMQDFVGYNTPKKNAVGECIERLKTDIPAADVRLNVTGTWVGIDDYPHEEWECDECGCIVSNSDDPWNYWHFCPNCGAKMVTEEA